MLVKVTLPFLKKQEKYNIQVIVLTRFNKLR
jgi:hypothetical protein